MQAEKEGNRPDCGRRETRCGSRSGKQIQVSRTTTFRESGAIKSTANTSMLAQDGSMYMWGHNKDGQLGNDSNMDSGKPVLVEQLRDAGLKVQSIACVPPHPPSLAPRAPKSCSAHLSLFCVDVNIRSVRHYDATSQFTEGNVQVAAGTRAPSRQTGRCGYGVVVVLGSWVAEIKLRGNFRKRTICCLCPRGLSWLPFL